MGKNEMIQEISAKYQIEIDSAFDEVVVTQIYSVLTKLPQQLLDVSLQGELKLHTALKNFKLGGSQQQASGYNGTEIIINVPFGVSQEIYAAMNKDKPDQRVLMNLGSLMGLPFLAMSGLIVDERSRFCALHEREMSVVQTLSENFSELKTGITIGGDGELIIDIVKYNGFVLIGKDIRFFQDGQTDPGIERYIMDGVAVLNCNERLLPWTIRHEIGHAVDNLIKWHEKKLYNDEKFGGWKEYDSFEGLLDDFKGYPGAEVDVEALKKKCFNYLFTFNDGGGVTAGPYTFMLDEYGKWVAYLTEARQQAVSNYQFAASKEWFAEAFAAYYCPNRSADILRPDVCAFFNNAIGGPVS